MQAKSSTSKKAHAIKNPAFAFGVYGNNARRIADVSVTDKGLIWSDGKASKEVVVKWDAFINWMESQLPAPAKKKAPAKAKAPASKAKAPATGKAKKVTKARAGSNGAKRAPAKKAATKASSAKTSASAATVH